MTDAQRKTLATLVEIVSEAIQAAGPRGVPSGHLYAALMGSISLSTYQAVIGALITSGRVKQQFHVLTWEGK